MNLGLLAIHATDRADSAVFEHFFTGYDRAFVLPDEKEDRDGLAECLALNHGQEHRTLAARFGPFRELCLVAETEDGRPVGGANFIAMPAAGTALVTANLNYIYIDPEARKQGNLRRLLSVVMDQVAGLFTATHGPLRPLVFIEQNDPFRMSAESYERDSRFTGIDQLDRLRIWARLGALVVDFPYVQPALSAEQAADDSLIYSVLGSSSPRLDAGALHSHLSRFFGISVLKGRPLEADRAAAAQLDRLKKMTSGGETIDLLDPAPLLDRYTSPRQAAQLLGRPLGSFRDELSSARP